MIRLRKDCFIILILITALSFLLTSCSSIPFIGKKKEDKGEKLPEGETVSVEGMANVKGLKPPKQETPTSQKPSAQPIPPKRATGTKVASIPTRPFSSPSLPFFQLGFKKKVVLLDFENKTTYKEEAIGEAVTKRLSDRLEATQRAVIMDKTVVSSTLHREGFEFETLSDPSVMKHAYQSLGIQAFVSGTITDMSILSSKASETSEEEVAFATTKIEVRLIDASTGNLLKTFIGRSPIFGTKETGELSRSKATIKAIELSLDEVLEGFLRQLDLLDWTTTVAKVEGENIYLNAGRLSGLRIGDTLEVFEPGREILHPITNLSLGWTHVLDPGAKPHEPFGERLECSAGGNTGRQADWPCRFKRKQPSVQFPTRIDGARAL